MDDFEVRRCERRQAEFCRESIGILQDGGRSAPVDDDDGLASAVEAFSIEAGQTVGLSNLVRRVAAAKDIARPVIDRVVGADRGNAGTWRSGLVRQGGSFQRMMVPHVV